MPVAKVQTAPHANATAASVTGTLPGAPTTNNFLVGVYRESDALSTVTLPTGWNWFPNSPRTAGSGRKSGFAYKKVSGDAAAVQFSSSNSASQKDLDVVEVSGIDPTDFLGPTGENYPQVYNVSELTTGSTGDLPMADMYVIGHICLGNDSDGGLGVDSGFSIVNPGDYLTVVVDKIPGNEAPLNPLVDWADITSAYGMIVSLKGVTVAPVSQPVASETIFTPLGGIVSPARQIQQPPEPDIILRGYPTPEVIKAIEAGNTEVTRRIEIYQHDAETVWEPDDEGIERLVEGNISIDYTRDERRSMDLTLDNTDNLLRPNPDDGFWYDKIIKGYRGVRFSPNITVPPSVVIVEESSANQAFELRSILWRMGFTDVTVNTSVTKFEDVKDYDIIASFRKTGATTKATLLNTAFAAGYKVLTFGYGSDNTHFPFIGTAAASASQTWAVNNPPYDTPAAGGWSNESYGSSTGRMITALAGPARAVATALSGATTHYTVIITENDNHGRWLHWQPDQVGTQGKILLKNAMTWLRDFRPYKMWEYKVGEFLVENINEDYFPGLTHVSGRDYTAKCMNSLIPKTLSFAAGTRLDTLVTALAANSGITKMEVPKVPDKLESRLDVEFGTERWRVMRDACEQMNYELFFNHNGVLIMRPYLDPTTSPISWTFKTGKQGNLVTYSRSTNDSRVKNHVIVLGGLSSDKDVLPAWGEAKNTESSSPTRIGRLGDRTRVRNAPWLKKDLKCRQMAQRILKIAALETYEISYSSYVYPWMEAGEIVKFLDPDREDTEPVRFLQDTISLPMGLGPMSATGKRVTYVDDTENPIEEVA